MPELDVELDVNEQPETPNFPRRPNVVSHRTHVLKFNVKITALPNPNNNWVTIAASVFTYGPERLGETEHVSRSRRLWGKKPGRVSRIDATALPARYEIVVPKTPGDDHLGQGPYEAIVTVNPITQATGQPPDPDPNAPALGSEFSIEFTSM
jgi:hypothetical protein